MGYVQYNVHFALQYMHPKSILAYEAICIACIECW